jgi:hypothetical protein
VDQARSPSIRMGSDLGLISQGWCLLSLDKTARWVGPFLLGVQAGSNCSERWSNTGAKENMEYHRVAQHLVQSHVPPYSDAAKVPAGGTRGQSVGIPLGPPRCCGSMVREETKQHSEEWRNQILYLCQQAQMCTCVWALNKGFTRYLKGSAGHQVTKMCSGYGVWTSELDYLG